MNVLLFGYFNIIKHSSLLISMELSVLIKNCTIVEGTGKKAYTGSIGIRGEKIASIGDVSEDAEKIIEAQGLVAA
ncbi:MAG: D-aminoacylase, partial [Candidatus Thorarchaeota archaeon]